MSGLVKQKEFKVEDSNVEMIGSKEDRDVKKASAATEAAWKGAGNKTGIKIWRIEDFQVKHWPAEDYGQFHKGDSYIILRTYQEKDSEELCYDLHFWLGKESTQDEMGTAAYKTVELDTLLDDKPIQYREVEGSESAKFRSLFEDGIIYLEGGVASGFTHVKEEMPPPKLFQLCGKTAGNISLNQIKNPEWNDLHIHNAFIIVVDKSIIRFFGSQCNKYEKWRATLQVGKFKSRVHKYESTDIILDDDQITRIIEVYGKNKDKDAAASNQDQDQDQDHDQDELSDDEKQDLEVYEKLKKVFGNQDAPEVYDIKTNKEFDDEEDCEECFTKKLLSVEHNKKTSKMEFVVLAEGEDVDIYKLQATDEGHVLILDDMGKYLFCYAGKKCNKNDKNNQMVYCCNYLQDKPYKNAPVSMVKNVDKFKGKLCRA